MDRRSFLGNALGANVLLASADTGGGQSLGPSVATPAIVIERPAPDRPHAGKVLAAIEPNANDIPLFASRDSRQADR